MDRFDSTMGMMSEIWGALFVGGLQLASERIIHDDQALLELEGCGCDDCASATPKCEHAWSTATASARRSRRADSAALRA